MKILIVSHFFPYPFCGGGGKRFQGLIGALQYRHDITFVVFVYNRENQEKLEDLRSEWHRVNIVTVPYPKRHKFNKFDKFRWLFNPFAGAVIFSHEMEETVRYLIRRGSYDIVQFEYAQTGQYLPPYAPPSILVEHDIISLSQLRRARVSRGFKKKIYEYKTWMDMKRYEYNILSRFNKIVTMSEVDRDILTDILPKLDISVVPNGVDTGYYKYSEDSLRPRLTFMAGIKHYANTDAAQYFIRDIWPLVKKETREIELYLLGNYPIEEEGDIDLSKKVKAPGIIWTGLVEDTRPYLAGSIFVVPLRIGSGTRLKILEAMSIGCAVISTSIGAEGISARDGEEILIADTPSSFARSILWLLKDSNRRREIGQKARALVEKKYDWRWILDIQEKVYREVSARYG